MTREVAVIGHFERCFGLLFREKTYSVRSPDGRLRGARVKPFPDQEVPLRGLPDGLKTILEPLDGGVTLNVRRLIEARYFLQGRNSLGGNG